jgi:putative transposase
MDIKLEKPHRLWLLKFRVHSRLVYLRRQRHSHLKSTTRIVVDAYSRMIVAWRVASHMRTTMVLDGIEMARWSREKMLGGLRCHSDAGSQFTSIRYGERLAEIGATPSIGTVGDCDNALAETVNGYYKSELIYGPARSGPWKTVEDVELATLRSRALDT